MSMTMMGGAVGWVPVVGMVYFTATFDSICPTMLLFLFEVGVAVAAQLRRQKDQAFVYETDEVDRVSPLFGLEDPSSTHTKAALFFMMAGHGTRLVLLFKMIAPPVDNLFWLTVQLLTVAAYCYVFFSVTYRTRSTFSEPDRRRWVVRFAVAVYTALTVVLLYGHGGRDQTYRHFRDDHRLKWAAFAHAFHGVLAYNNGGRFCLPPDRLPVLSWEWAQALNFVGWTMLWFCSGHHTLLQPEKGFF